MKEILSEKFLVELLVELFQNKCKIFSLYATFRETSHWILSPLRLSIPPFGRTKHSETDSASLAYLAEYVKN
ncbi:hypothetical protein FACS189425_05960 [Clostridia bacterium]|nr:hypothetical protein FACS189425_05960 [Clostridia bacterium]